MYFFVPISLIQSVCYRNAKCEFVGCLLETHVAENCVRRDVGQRGNTNLSSVFVTCIYSTVLNIRTQQRLSRHFSTGRVLRLFLLKQVSIYKFTMNVGCPGDRHPPEKKNYFFEICSLYKLPVCMFTKANSQSFFNDNQLLKQISVWALLVAGLMFRQHSTSVHMFRSSLWVLFYAGYELLKIVMFTWQTRLFTESRKKKMELSPVTVEARQLAVLCRSVRQASCGCDDPHFVDQVKDSHFRQL